jgi:chromosome segregation ATPase
MNIEVSTEIVAAIGGLIISVVFLMVYIVRHLTAFAQSLESGQKVNAALNDELLSVINERSAERQQYDQDRRAMLASMSTIRDEWRAEVDGLKTKIDDLETEIARLERSLEVERDLRRKDLTAFQAQINEKNAQIAELKTERNDLRARVDNLETAMNGKVDKPSTDDVTQAAAQVAAQAQEKLE